MKKYALVLVALLIGCGDDADDPASGAISPNGFIEGSATGAVESSFSLAGVVK